MKNEKWGIHWFRRDLRIPGNPALMENWKRTEGRTLGLFCFDSKFLSRSDFSNNRFAFFIKTLKSLKKDLQESGGDLLVVDCLPSDFFPNLLSYLKENKKNTPTLVSWNRDYEPYARFRDKKIEELLKNHTIDCFHSRDHLLFEPHEIKRNENDFYQIYSPFAKKWFDKMQSAEGQRRIQAQKKMDSYFKIIGKKSNLFQLTWKNIHDIKPFPFTDSLNQFEEQNNKKITIPIPQAGFLTAYKNLQKFKSKLENYKDKRDFLTEEGTSKLSIYLKNGSLTVSQIIYTLGLDKLSWSQNTGAVQFLKELVWREFYYSILYYRPDVEAKSFLPQHENIKWENNKEWFQKWKSGLTGFPIVDAGMRELLTTGLMHNRVRMIVASFLTKDLLISWRWGENHFMKELLDGDLAANNGGWQWAASTGCDPQPYFRIFNPWLQGKKFDPNGEYIKKYISELKDAPIPILHDAEADRSSWNYPQPIVDHSIQREVALKLYKK